MKKHLVLYILLLLFARNSFSIVDTIFVSHVNPTYVEYSGTLIFCDIGVYQHEEKKATKNEIDNTLLLSTENYNVKIGNNMGIIIAKKEAHNTKLFIKTTCCTYEILLVYKDIEGDIKYYNLKNVEQTENSSSKNNEESFSYAVVTDLPEDLDLTDKKELLKYDNNIVLQKLKKLNFQDDKYQEIGIDLYSLNVIVTGLANDNTHYFIKIRFTNNSTVDYKLENSSFEYVNVLKENFLSKKREKIETQNNVIKIENNVVKGKEQKTFCYAVPILALDNKSYIRLSFSEYQGNRKIVLKIKSKKLNECMKI